mgnify:CR=1 FL=1
MNFLDFVVSEVGYYWENITDGNIFNETALQILNSAKADWDKADDKEKTNIEYETGLKLSDMDNIFKRKWEFTYTQETEDGDSEYSGFIADAPNEEIAWAIFLGIDGEFGIPSSSDYSIKEVTPYAERRYKSWVRSPSPSTGAEKSI